MKTIKQNPSFYRLDFVFLTLTGLVFLSLIFINSFFARDLSNSVLFLRPNKVESSPMKSNESLQDFSAVDESLFMQNLKITSQSISGEYVDISKSKKPSIAFSVDNTVYDTDPRRFYFGIGDSNINFEFFSENNKSQVLSISQSSSQFEVIPISDGKSHFSEISKHLNSYLVTYGATDDSRDKFSSDNVSFLDLSEKDDWSVALNSRPENSNIAVYTDGVRNSLIDSFGYQAPNSWFKFKREIIDVERFFEKEEINIDISFGTDFSYKIRYKYDPLTNSYNRFMGDEPYIDYLDETQIQAKNVIILQTDFEILNNPEREIFFDFSKPIRAYYFFDGRAIQVDKGFGYNKETGFSFFNNNGDEISFNRGNFWIEVVPITSNISYS